MSTSRRAFLGHAVSGGALAGLAAGCGSSLPPLAGTILGRHRAERGHRVWTPARVNGPPRTADVVVVGGGVAGLSAAWRLAEAGRSVVLLELDDVLGGTAQAGRSEGGATRGMAFALGAHYITIPNVENRLSHRLLTTLGVFEGVEAGRPLVAAEALCLAPQERLFVAGEWSAGLWPAALASTEDNAQKEAWEDVVRQWTHRMGADGLPAFSIPIAYASRDPEIRALADIPFSVWLDQQGFSSTPLRWLIEYATRDDYGTTLADTSAWAGLHYHCARRPEPANDRDLGTHVLTWPAGNGWLVAQMETRLLGAVERHVGVVVRAVEPDTGRVHGEKLNGDSVQIDAQHVILAVPAGVASRLVGRATEGTPRSTPWRVGVLSCAEPLASRGVPLAWDSVRYDADDLGVICNAHQRGQYGGPTVLSWYQPLAQDPENGRAELFTADWASEADRILASLAPAHPNLRAAVERLDVWHWGHGTIRPEVGLHRGDRLAQWATPLPRVHFAHTDLSGLSLFEEALWHGVRAAEEVLEISILDERSWR